MVEDLPVKQIRNSLEVVAVFADHSPKVKSDTCFRVLKITECISCVLNMHVPFFSSYSLSFYRVLEACLCVMSGSHEACILMMTWPQTASEWLMWCRPRAQQLLSPWTFNDFDWIATGRASRSPNLIGVINACTSPFNAPWKWWMRCLLFKGARLGDAILSILLVWLFSTCLRVVRCSFIQPE